MDMMSKTLSNNRTFPKTELCIKYCMGTEPEANEEKF